MTHFHPLATIRLPVHGMGCDSLHARQSRTVRVRHASTAVARTRLVNLDESAAHALGEAIQQDRLKKAGIEKSGARA